MGQRFKRHLERAQADLGETDPDITESLHGLRAGGALFMALSGKSLADIMLQGFWKSPDTARRYIGLLERIVGDEFALAVRKHGIVTVGRILTSPTHQFGQRKWQDTICSRKMLYRRGPGYRLALQAPNRWQSPLVVP